MAEQKEEEEQNVKPERAHERNDGKRTTHQNQTGEEETKMPTTTTMKKNQRDADADRSDADDINE